MEDEFTKHKIALEQINVEAGKLFAHHTQVLTDMKKTKWKSLSKTTVMT